MKNKILLLLLLTVAALATVCAVQWRQLQAARNQLAQAQSAVQTQAEYSQALEDKVKGLQKQGSRLGQDIDTFTRLVNSLRAAQASQASNPAQVAPQAPGGADTNGPDAEKGGLFGGKGMGGMLSKMMKDPAMKEMVQSQQKMMVQKMYGPLLKELNLGPEQKDKFMELVLDNQMAAVEQAGALLGGGDTGKAEAAKAVKDKENELQANLKLLLGEDQYAQYADYKTTLGERLQLDQFRQQLEGGSAPLQDEQLKALMQAMKEERGKVPPVLPTKAGENPADMAKLLTDETIEKQFQWQADLNRRVQERAGQFLSPDQLKEFTDFQAQQISVQKVGMKMARELFGAGKAPPAPAEVAAPPAK